MRTQQRRAQDVGCHRPSRGLALGLLVASLGLAACSGAAASAPPGATSSAAATTLPVRLEAVPGKAVKKVMLTERAAERIGIETIAVAPAPAGAAAPATVVPYSAVVYDSNGQAWVYTVSAPLTCVREGVVVSTVGGAQGTDAVLSSGPPAGGTVVVRGVIELYGAELGIGK